MSSNLLTIEDFAGKDGWTVSHHGNKQDHYAFYHKEGNAGVLGVAHMDSVASQAFVSPIMNHPAGKLFLMPQADDRLGVYLITEFLKKFGVNCDILLTDNEERGGTTARKFMEERGKELKGQYNWIFSFDRMGGDVAMYCYLCDEMETLVGSYGMEAVTGSFSCIRAMEDLGCKGFNWGTAYHNYHSEWAYVKVDQLVDNVGKFIIFYNANKDKKHTHEVKVFPTTRPAYQGYASRGYWPSNGGLQGTMFDDTYEEGKYQYPAVTPKPAVTTLSVKLGRNFMTPETDLFHCTHCGRFFNEEEVNIQNDLDTSGAGLVFCPNDHKVLTGLYAA